MEKSSVCKKETQVSHRPKLNLVLDDESVKKKVLHAFQNGSDYDDSTISISGYPFTHGVIKNFVTDGTSKATKNPQTTDSKFLQSLKSELLNLEFNEKSNDLFKFVQSNELMLDNEDPADSSIFQPRKNVNQLCSLFRDSMLPWIREITGVELNDTIDMFCAQYKKTDVLLCHDDELEDRRIAYIFYLTDDWSEKDGGTLDLFSVDESGDPDMIMKSLVPSFNTLVFFDVSPISYHQVSEILAENKVRLSLSGWFHGSPLPRPIRPLTSKCPAITFLPAQQDLDLLSQWINPGYLSIETQGTIQEQFEGSSEIQLPGFLVSDKYKELSESMLHLSKYDQFWTSHGPPNRRKYEAIKFDQDFEISENDVVYSPEKPENSSAGADIDESKKLQISVKTMEAYNLINDFIRLFCSEEMFLYLSNITGLYFHPMAANIDDTGSDVTDDVTDPIPAKRTKSSDKKSENVAGLNSKCRYEVRCWSKGCYTLLRDTDSERGEFALDVNLHCCAEGWQQDYGGYTTYIAQGEDTELLTVLPSSNCLSLAYRDSEALRFVKHVNHKAPKPYFDISFVYCE
ncbi:prolyl 3-hydroxylase OGFOD1-like [Styela clava]